MFQREVEPGIMIRLFEDRDAEAVFAAVERDRTYLREWLPWVDPARSTQEIRDFIGRSQAQWEENRSPNCGIWVNGEIAGCIGCHAIDYGNRNCSIGYWLSSAMQGRGIITKCCMALLDYLFGELDLHRVEIRCGTGNLRSGAVPQRLGFTREGVVRGAQWVNDRWLDLVIWGMLETEWRAR
jgi:ribosomal-protein-serine acetyltransferase